MRLHPRLQGPFALLATSAALQLLMVVSILAMFMLTLLGRLVQVASNGSLDELAMAMGALTIAQGAFKLPQMVLVVSGAMTARAAYHLQSEGRLSAIRWGAAAGVVGPLIALITNLCAVLSFDCIGLVFGGLGRFVLLGLGIAAWVTVVQSLQEPELAALFHTDEDREDAFQRS
ncbi:MAG: hypothetical protein KC912_26380 [Proteobacteria bacterium]|nr:hypothetical protein [Pseudomonadota bacterium]